jgi:signal transduction histidine kinase/ligand-binding sensor domain-containing protein
MKKTIHIKIYVVLINLFFSLCILSCHKSSTSEAETTVGNYKTPETIPLKFTEPETFEWETVTSADLTTPVTYSLNVDALPSKPFELNTFKPLKTPMKSYVLDWDNVPREPLKFDSVPFTVTKTTIKKPIISKMKPPSDMEGTYANLMQLSTTEGMVSNDIASLLEAEDGAIWISSYAATQSLIRYDGENAFGYDYPNIIKMTIDKKGRLWFARAGLHLITVLDFKNDIEYTIKQTDNFTPLDILCDHTGSIYIVSVEDGVYRIDPEMKQLQKIANRDPKALFSLFEDSQNNLWIGDTDGVSVIDTERKAFKTLTNFGDDKSNAMVFDIKEDRSGAIWLCLIPNTQENLNDGSKIVRISPKESTIKILDKENGYDILGRRTIEDAQGNLWIFGETDAFILSQDRTDFKILALNSTIDFLDSVPLKRKDASIWMPTRDKGILITNDFTLGTNYFDETNGLINGQIWDIEENSTGDIWLGTMGGINIIDLKNQTIQAISHEQLHSVPGNRINAIREVSTDVYFINTSTGFTILERKENKLTQYANNPKTPFRVVSQAIVNDHTFLLYTSQGLFLYDIQENSLKKAVSKVNPDLLQSTKNAIMFYDNDLLWIPSNTGLAKVDLKTNSVSYLTEKQGLCHDRGSLIIKSKEGEFWLGTLNGISILNLEAETLTNLKDENGLYPAEFYDLIEKGDTIYAGSVNGLIPINKSTVKTTNKGFFNFNGGLGFKSNDYLQGSPKLLKNGQFWAGVSKAGADFKLLILDGAPKPDRMESSVYITNMFVMDESPGFDNKHSVDSLNTKKSSYATRHEMQWDSITLPYELPKGLVLPYDQNSLSFSYGSSDAFNREQLTYRFILDGEDADWTYASSTTKTKNYYNLKPGNYTFKVSSRNSNQEWSAPAQFEFRIAPPWWQTWWAYVLFGIVIMSVLRAYIIFRAKKLKRENRILEERVTDRTEQLNHKIDELKSTQSQLIQSEKMASLGELTAGIAHEIQNPLNFVNNFSELSNELIDEMNEEIDKGDFEEAKFIAKDIKANLEKINHHGKRADSIVKGMLHHSRSSSGTKEPTDINKLADEYLRLAYHGLRAKDKSFNATLETDFDDSIGKIPVLAQDIGRVILNLITNAFYACNEKKKSGTADYEPKVTVSTKKLKDSIAIAVNDNGNGIPKQVLDKIFQPFFTTKPTGEGTGLGLSMSYDIITQGHGGELKVETKENEGTTFTIVLPI